MWERSFFLLKILLILIYCRKKFCEPQESVQVVNLQYIENSDNHYRCILKFLILHSNIVEVSGIAKKNNLLSLSLFSFHVTLSISAY